MMDALLSWRPSSWSDWLLVYLVPGLCMGVFFISKMFLDRPSEFGRNITKLLGKELTLKERLQEIALFSLGFFCVVIGWPGFLIWYFKDKRDEVKRQEWQALPNFECAPQYLVKQVNPIDAEIASYVIDPIEKVPPLPFGHLNKGWVNFLTNLTDEADEMWSFYIPQGSKTGKYQFECSSEISGYAGVRKGEIFAEFITESD